MAANYFMKIDGIPGESTDDKHKEWIEIQSYNIGLMQSGGGEISATGSLAGGRPDFSEFTITKAMDKSSPKIAFACAKGDPIKEVLVELWRHIGDNSKFFEYKLTKAMIKSVSVGGAGGSDLPSETITFVFTRIDWTYTEYDNDHKKKGDIKGFWDLAANKGG